MSVNTLFLIVLSPTITGNSCLNKVLQRQLPNGDFSNLKNLTFISQDCILFISIWTYEFFYSMICNPFSSVQSLSHVRLFATPWIAAHQASLSNTSSWSSPKLICIESVMSSSHLILVPFSSCPQSLPASGSFPMSQLFTWGDQSIGVSALASVLPMNTQDWSPTPNLPLLWREPCLEGAFLSTKAALTSYLRLLLL